MPTGERAARGRPQPRVDQGFTYLLLLFSVALMGAALATLGTQWQQAAQREREAELLFRGLQIRDALQRFNALTPAGARPLPLALDELLIDRRALVPHFHLRRLYADPFSGRADWALLRDAAGGIVGVHSRSQRPALRQHDLPALSGAAVPAAPVASEAPAAPAAPGAAPPGPAVPGSHRPGSDSALTTAEPAPAPARVADWQFRIQPQMTVPRKPP
jgi:type II secretory pathway pseudopilin PulG